MDYLQAVQTKRGSGMKKLSSSLSNSKTAELILESIPKPVIMVGNDGIVSYINRSMEEFLNFERDDILGSPLVKVLFVVQGFNRQGGYRNPVMETLLTGREFTDQLVEVKTANNIAPRLLQVTTFLVRGCKGNVRAVCAFFSKQNNGSSFPGSPNMASKQFETIFAFAEAIGARDGYTLGHSEKVAEYTRLIAQRMELSDKTVDMAYLCGIVHDIGKIGIPGDVLNKRGPLNHEEYQLVMGHSRMGASIISHINWLEEIVPVVESHHERYNGSGYPTGLRGQQIPLLGRILAVADAFDAMTTDRSYRKAYSLEKAVEELKNNAGSQFDPQVVDTFINMIGEFS